MLSVTFLGTSAARPTVERSVSSIAVMREGETLLFDCGEGTQRQMMRYGVGFSLQEIFFTHFHADHYLGVIGLVRTLALQGRIEPMTLYGPPGAQSILGAALDLGVERSGFQIDIREVKAGDVLERNEYDIQVFRAEHGRAAVGYALKEHIRLGRFDPERARERNVPEGPLWGRIHRGETITLDNGRTISPEELVGDPRAGRSVVLSGDTRPCEPVTAAASGADLLVHDATFAEEEKERARETGHSTAAEAAEVAAASGVKRLLLTHLSARYSANSRLLLEEAQAVFAETMVAKDGLTVEVEFSE